MDDAESFIKPLEATVDKVRALIASDENFSVKAGIDENEKYFHLLTRHDFSFVDINGQLDSVEVRCDAKREKYTVS
jgi:hypothetical protein